MGKGRLLLTLGILFGLVQLGYHLLGVAPLWSTSSAWDWHLIDHPLLEHRLAQSIFYLHTQPPLWNLFIALLLALPGQYQMVFFPFFFIPLGFVSYSCLFWLMKFMQTPNSLALLLSTLFMASPTFALLEHGTAYDFPIMALLTISAAALWKFLEKPTYSKAFSFFSILAVVCLTRSTFHLLYFVLTAAIVAVMNRNLYKVVYFAALPGLLLVLSLYVKNYVVFNKFTASTWMGMNAAKVVIRSTPLAEREAWNREGIVSEVMLIEPWSDLSEYPDRFRRTEARFSEIPLLTKTNKEDGYKNLHNAAYIAVADQYLSDVIRVIRYRPLQYLRGLGAAWYCYFRATDESEFLPYRDVCVPVINTYDYLVYGKSPWAISYATDRKGSYNLYLVLVIALPLLFVYGITLLKDKSLSRNQKTVIALMLFNIAFVAITTNFLELAENQRSRFYTDSFSMVLLANFIHSRKWRCAIPRRTST